jgi:hypothetical protein
VEVATPGWSTAHIRPQPCGLKSAEGKIPTPKGPVTVTWKDGDRFLLSIKLPAGMSAKIDLPAREKSTGVFLNGKPLAAKRSGLRWLLEKEVSGTIDLEVHKQTASMSATPQARTNGIKTRAIPGSRKKVADRSHGGIYEP